MSLRDQLQAIYDKYGQLTPELVVQTARDPEHPLHLIVFDRDVNAAAEAYYRDRAHDLIRRVRVVFREGDDAGPEKSVRAFHAVRGPEGHVYEPIEKVAEDPFTRKLLLADMEREWRQMYDRYGHMEEFLQMVTSAVEVA